MRRILLVALGAIALASCTKVAGEGGNSTIKGTVSIDYRIVLTNPASYQSTVPGADEDVYIVYGDHVSPDDRVQTDYNGAFEFRNLRPGDYTLYVYSGDTTGSAEIHPNRMPILVDVTINERKETVDVGEMKIYDNP